jgi:uncharacterized repeat protein (TIGR01451 family)
MRIIRVLFPIVFGFLLTFGFIHGIAQASSQVIVFEAPNAITIFVDADATGTATGLSWTDAYTSLQDALAVAVSGDEVWVAEGIYYPDEGIGQTNNYQGSSFILINGVALFGGFSGTETLRVQRNWEANVTVLSGDIDKNDTTDVKGVVTHTNNIAGSNAYHVVFSSGVTESTIIDGFNITAGQANSMSLPCADECGGGMYNTASNPMLENLIFSGNWAYIGGGMFNSASSPTLNNVTFAGNFGEDGGGMTNWSNSNPSLNNVIITGNSAYNGGGMNNSSSSPSLTNVIFSGNSVMDLGGGMGNGGGIRNSNDSNPLFTNVSFSGNTAERGGAMYNYSSEPRLINTILWENVANTSGDQIYNNSSTPVISYTLIQNSGGSTSWDTSLGIDVGNNIDTDPHFVRDPYPGSDGNWDGVDDDYGDLHLQTGSLAIDSGTNISCPATDLDGTPRPVGEACDMGAYEAIFTIYVDTDATGAATGLSWTDAYTNLQDALSIATTGYEIWVAEGIYYPDEGIGQINDVITSTFTMTDGVAIYGGFAATETLQTQRNWEANITVLSGDIDKNDITDTYGVVTDTDNIVGSNAYHVISNNGITSTAILDGFWITAGQANSGYPPDNQGGGMHNIYSSPTLANVIFLGNSAFNGGGMYNEGNSDVTLSAAFFFNNSAEYYGGGISIHNNRSTLDNVTFWGNSSGHYGGGMYNGWGSNVTITNVTFLANSANEDGGGMYNFSTNPTLRNVIFVRNSATFYGGGMLNHTSDPSIKNVTFSGNSAGYRGGGVYNEYSDPTLTNAILWGNAAGFDNSQLYNHISFPTINYSDILGCGGSSNWNSSCGTNDGMNIEVDPFFVRNPDPGPDGEWDGIDDDYGDLHLQAGSPAIDSGTNTDCPATDLEGTPRPIGEACDMGAYEFASLDLKLLLDNPTPKPGETITFTIHVTNYLKETITNGLISNTLPANLNFLETITLDPPMSGTVGSALPILVTGLEIGTGEQITVTLPVNVSNGLAAGIIITNTAWITSNEVITPVSSSISITIANAAPIAVDDLGSGFITDEDTTFTTSTVLANDTDPNGDTLALESFNTTGTLGLVTSNGDGTFDYDPNGQFEYLGPGEQATESFTYTISDGHGGTDTATVTITITGVQDGFYIYLPVVMRP